MFCPGRPEIRCQHLLVLPAASLPRIKWVICNFSMTEARNILDEVLLMEDSQTIRAFLNARLDKAGLGGLVRAGK